MNNNIRYNKLPELLHKVRWSQHLAAIIAEALMVGAFFLSGLDVAVGGVMATNGVVRWLWGVMFSISLDSLFIISWLRVKKAGWSWHLAYTVPIALAMSVTVFLPVLVQLLQSSLVINFTTALDMLGVGLVPLVIVRALVSVVLGAVLALTNSEETATTDNPVQRVTSIREVKSRQLTVPTLSNNNAGRPTRIDPQRVIQAIQDNPGMTDRQVSELLGDVSKSSVWYIRQKLNQNGTKGDQTNG